MEKAFAGDAITKPENLRVDVVIRTPPNNILFSLSSYFCSDSAVSSF